MEFGVLYTLSNDSHQGQRRADADQIQPGRGAVAGIDDYRLQARELLREALMLLKVDDAIQLDVFVPAGENAVTIDELLPRNAIPLASEFYELAQESDKEKNRSYPNDIGEWRGHHFGD
jgi:hypothetical protein